MSVFSFKCPTCGGSHSIDSTEAELSCHHLMSELERAGNLDFKSENPAPELSTAPLFTDTRGQMFGVLICELPDSEGSIILKAFSGQYNGIWEVDGWMPPVLDSKSFSKAVNAADPPIKKLSAEINSSSCSSERDILIEKRKRLSQQHMREIHEMYTIRNFTGSTTDLFSLFVNRPGIPAGTGDCCAPKLLNQAIRLGLKPLSLAEFFWGAENRSGTKKHGCFYPPCEEKCVPILGYMLHGFEPGGKDN